MIFSYCRFGTCGAGCRDGRDMEPPNQARSPKLAFHHVIFCVALPRVHRRVARTHTPLSVIGTAPWGWEGPGTALSQSRGP